MGRVDPATVALGAVMAAAAIVLLYAGRHLTFFYDEWNYVLMRRGGSLDAYLAPHNGHLSLFPVLVYKLLFVLVGMRHYWPYRAVGVGMELVCAGALYVLARRRLGPWLALVPSTLLLFMGSAFQVLLWPFQIGYLGSIAAGLGALALLEPPDRTRDGWASALLVGSIASSGVGIPFVAACAVLLIARGASWRRLWIVLIPAALYVAWYIGWGTAEQTTAQAVLGAPQYVASAAAGAVAGLAGLNDATWGAPLTVALIALIALSWRFRLGGGPTPMLLAACTGVLAFWALAAIARADYAEPAASRYLYVGAAFIWLIVAEARLGVRVPLGWLAPAAVVVLGALIANAGMLRDGESALRASDTSVRTALAAVEIASPVVSPAFQPDPVNAPQLTAGPYLAAVRDLGSPAYTLSELSRQTEGIREHADVVLEHAEQLSPAPSDLPVSAGLCESLRPTAAQPSLQLSADPGSSVLIRSAPRAVVRIGVRRLAASFVAAPFASAPARGELALRFPVDRAPQLPWRLRVTSTRALLACVRSG